MSQAKKRNKSFDLKAASIFGVILGFSGIFLFGGIYFIVSLFDFSLTQFIKNLGLIAFYCCFMLLLGPFFGFLIAIGEKSWNLFKTWLIASIIGIIINSIIAAFLLNMT